MEDDERKAQEIQIMYGASFRSRSRIRYSICRFVFQEMTIAIATEITNFLTMRGFTS